MQRDPNPIHSGMVDEESYFSSLYTTFTIFDSDFGQHLFHRKDGEILEIILYNGAIHGMAIKA